MPIEVPEIFQFHQLRVAIHKADVDGPGQIVLWIELHVLGPVRSSVAGQGEADHGAIEIVTCEKITGRRVVRLGPSVDPVAVGDDRGAGRPGAIRFVSVFFWL